MTRSDEPRATGSCLCGSVTYSVHGPLRDVIVCHCRMCRRLSSHASAFSACAPGDLRIAAGRNLRWYRSSPSARRGFCSKCGAQLFWEPAHGGHISISAGSLDEPTHLKIIEQIFLDAKGDYYDVVTAATDAHLQPDRPGIAKKT